MARWSMSPDEKKRVPATPGGFNDEVSAVDEAYRQ